MSRNKQKLGKYRVHQASLLIHDHWLLSFPTASPLKLVDLMDEFLIKWVLIDLQLWLLGSYSIISKLLWRLLRGWREVRRCCDARTWPRGAVASRLRNLQHEVPSLKSIPETRKWGKDFSRPARKRNVSSVFLWVAQIGIHFSSFWLLVNKPLTRAWNSKKCKVGSSLDF